ncbi:MAG: HEAT repeat domain-containing protein [Candidatus Riflebacteria bacterium]|nr:HEAT repeat domain-containing protein [Candidatus Riflebacteria bacterium]
MPSPHDRARIEACARSPFRAVRLHALEKLGAESHPRLAELLASLLRDPDGGIRLEAVRVAGATRCRDVQGILLELLNSDDETVALQAAVSLGELGYYGELSPGQQMSSSAPLAQQAPMHPVLFYALFAILCAGLFLSGYFFRAQMEPEAGPPGQFEQERPPGAR